MNEKPEVNWLDPNRAVTGILGRHLSLKTTSLYSSLFSAICVPCIKALSDKQVEAPIRRVGMASPLFQHLPDDSVLCVAAEQRTAVDGQLKANENNLTATEFVLFLF